MASNFCAKETVRFFVFVGQPLIAEAVLCLDFFDCGGSKKSTEFPAVSGRCASSSVPACCAAEGEPTPGAMDFFEVAPFFL